MQSTNETAQPVNAAITEADALAFVAAKQAEVKAEFPEASITLHGATASCSVSSYVKEHVFCSAPTIGEALAKYRTDINNPIKLRAKAASLLAEAEALEAKQGGAK